MPGSIRVRAVSIIQEDVTLEYYSKRWVVCIFEAWPDRASIWRWMDILRIIQPLRAANGRRLPEDTQNSPSQRTIKEAQKRAKTLNIPYIPGLVLLSTVGLSDLELLTWGDR